MAEETNQTRAVAYAVRAYPADKQFFQELATKFENQQRAFKALCDNWRNKDANQESGQGTGSEETEILKQQLENALNTIDSIKRQNEDLEKQLSEISNPFNKKLAELETELSEAKAALKNPFLIELTQSNAENLRRARKFIVNDGYASAENYPTEATNAAIKYFLKQEFSNYIK